MTRTASWHRSKDARGQVTHSLIDGEGNILGYATQTGHPGRDDYPWDWWLAHTGLRDLPPGRKASGVTDTLKAAKVEVRLSTGAHTS